MSFHGGIGAAVILGGLIEGATIVSSDFQTDLTRPYIAMGPNINAGYVGDQFPAVEFVGATDNFDTPPSIVYAETNTGPHELVVQGGFKTADAKSQAMLILADTDRDTQPGLAQLQGQSVQLNTQLASIASDAAGNWDVLGNLINQTNYRALWAWNQSGTWAIGSDGKFTITHNRGANQTNAIIMANSPNNLCFAAIVVTSTYTQFQARLSTTGAVFTGNLIAYVSILF